MTSIKSLSTSPDTIDEPSFREPQKDFLCKNAKEGDKLGIISEGERTEIEDSLTHMTIDPSCAQTTAQP